MIRWPLLLLGTSCVVWSLLASAQDGEFRSLLGKVTKVLESTEAPEEDPDAPRTFDKKLPPPSFEMKASGKKIRVQSSSSTSYVEHHVTTLKEFGGGRVWLLGQRQGKTRAPEGGSVEEQIIGVAAIIATDDENFTPPKIPKKAKLSKYTRWMPGNLVMESDQTHFRLDSTNVQVGADRKIIVEKTGDPAEFKKKATVHVTGRLDKEEKKLIMYAYRVVKTARGKIPGYEFVIPR